MKRFVLRPAFLLTVGILILSFSLLQAQSTESSILGNVRDAAGATVPGAKVTLTNQGTNDIRTQTTDSAGDYRFSGILAGRYSGAVGAKGFKARVTKDIDVDLSQIRRVDATMEVGDVSTTVTVEGGSGGHIETESAALSVISTAQDFAELPYSVYGRSWVNVAKVSAGVQAASGVEVNGGRDTANNFTADGLSANDIVSSRQTPNGFSGDMEAFQEMQVTTANNSAEYAQIAQFAVISKSGQNTPHGSVFFSNYNNHLSARSWSNPTSVPGFENYNQYSATNGGPVYIPHLYNGKDKTFYFFSYGGARYRTNAENEISVPTAAFRGGDFSSLLGSIPVLDPTTGQQFQGNIVPAARISPVSKALQDLIYPSPNLPGQGSLGLVSNYYTNPGSLFNADNLSTRLDHKFSDKNYFFARVALTIHNQDYNPGPLLHGYSGTGDNDPGVSLILSDNQTITSRLVNEVKLGYAGQSFDVWGLNNVANVVQKIGLQGIANPSNDPALSAMPDFEIGGNNGFQGTGSSGYRSQTQNTFQATDNLSWFQGRHNLKAGFDLRRYQVNDQNLPQDVTGTLSFDDQLSGFAYANLLLGNPSYADLAIARPNAYIRSTQQGYYIQDEFKVSPRITLTYGLRYEHQTPWTEKFNRFTSLDLKNGNMVVAGSSMPTDLVPAVAANLKIETATQAGLPTRSLLNSDNNNWSPRIGLALRPFGNDKTVVRLGYGLFTAMWPGLLGTGATGGPWQSTQSWYIADNQPNISLPNPFASSVQGYSGVWNVNGNDPNFPHERTQQWNVSVGRQIWKTAIDVAYVGTKGKNLPFAQNLHLLAPSPPPFSYSSLPYQQYGNFGYNQTGGSSIYHGLNVKANRRVGRGLTFNANYTWAKSLTDVGLNGYLNGAQQNQYNRALERGDDPAIRRHLVIFSYIYELPLGHGRALLGNASGLLDKLISGWQAAGTTTMTSGARLSPAFSGVDPANTNQFGGRPDRVGGGMVSGNIHDLIESHQRIFDKSAFVVPAAGRGYYGNSGRDILTGPGAVTWNMSLGKNVYLFSERARAQLRFEGYNAFNHPNFNNPSTNISGSSFGLVTGAATARRIQVSARIDF